MRRPQGAMLRTPKPFETHPLELNSPDKHTQMSQTLPSMTMKRYLEFGIALCILIAPIWYTRPPSTNRRPGQPSPAGGPVFSTPEGVYQQDILLKIYSKTAQTILFTTDGRIPTRDTGTVYTHPIYLGAAEPTVAVIRAREVRPGGELGPVSSASYLLGIHAALPIMSLIIDPPDFWSQENGLYVHLDQRGKSWERPVEITYIERDRRSGFHASAGIRLHGEWSRAFDKKGLRLYFRRKYGDSRLEYPLFGRKHIQSFDRLVLHNGGNDSPQPHINWTLLRNQLIDRLAAQLEGQRINSTWAFESSDYAPRNQPVLLFINGQPWGIYQLRERIDETFLRDRYGITHADLLDSPAHISVRNTMSGDRRHWDRLLQFINTHNLADPDNYEYICTQVDIENLIDYTLLQVYSGNADWPEHNVTQFRAHTPGGRWQWLLWDNDYSFGLHFDPNFEFEGAYVELDLMNKALRPDNTDTDGNDTLLFRKLVENPDFVNRFLARAADLLNTTFAPDTVLSEFDTLVAAIAPDIGYETSRWSSRVNWTSSVQEMRAYIQARPNLVRQHIVQAFDLDGTATLVLNTLPTGQGNVAVNGALLPNLSWQGVYFRGVEIDLDAVPAPGYRFAGWLPASLEQKPAIRITINATQNITPCFERAEPVD